MAAPTELELDELRSTLPEGVEIEVVPLDQLEQQHDNVREHTARSLQITQDSIQRVGFMRSTAAVRLPNGKLEMMAGSGTLEAAAAAGATHAIVIRTPGDKLIVHEREVDEIDRIAYSLADNAASDASFNSVQRMAELSERNREAMSLAYNRDEIAAAQRKWKAASHVTPPDAAPRMDHAAALRDQYGVESGQVWLFHSLTSPGERHRLVVGDCTDRAVAYEATGDRFIDMIFTDPPYGIAYQDNYSPEEAAVLHRRTGYQLDIPNDDLDAVSTKNLVRASLEAIEPYVVKGAPFYICAPPGDMLFWFMLALMEANGGDPQGKDRPWLHKQTIAWVKQNFVMGRQDYHYRHEALLYGWKAGAAHSWYGGRDQDTVWEIPRPSASKDYPIIKPVELVERALQNSAQPGTRIYDGFAGSGTTFAACERKGYLCSGVEIFEDAAAVIIQRMVDMGLTAECEA